MTILEKMLSSASAAATNTGKPVKQTVAIGIAVLVCSSMLYMRRRWKRFMKWYETIPLPALEDYCDEGKKAFPWLLYFGGALIMPPDYQIIAFERMGKPKLFKTRIFHFTHLLSCHPEDINIPSTKRKAKVYEIYRDFLGADSIIFQEGQKARKEKTMLNKGFGQQTYRSFHPTMIAISQRLLKRMVEGGDRFNIDQLISRATLEVIADCGFSMQVDKEENIKYLNALKALFRIPGNPVVFLPYGLQIAKWWNRESLSLVDELLTKTVTERIKELSTKEIQPTEAKDLLDMVIIASRSVEHGEQQKSVSWIRDQVQLFFIGGSDTSSVTLHWAFIMLARYPDLQAKLKAEISQVFASESNEFDRISKLSYVEAFIKEVLRLYVPLGMVPRRPDDEDTEFHGIPARDEDNINIVFASSLVHRLDEYFPNPNELSPERWFTPGQANSEIFTPFSTGFRSCIGKNFAMIEMKTVLSQLLYKHHIVASDPNAKIPLFGMQGQVGAPIGEFFIKMVPDSS